MSCCGGGGGSGGGGRLYRPYGPSFTTAGAVSCCGGPAITPPCGPSSCATQALSTFYATPANASTILNFSSDVSSQSLAPGLTVTATCPVTVALVFSGTLQLINQDGLPISVTVSLTLQYYNTLLPSSVLGAVVPVTASLSAPTGESGPFVPISASLDVTLPAGTYVLQPTFTLITGSPPIQVVATGTLNAVVTKSASGAYGCC